MGQSLKKKQAKTEVMTKETRMLGRIGKVLDLDKFYSIRIGEGDIVLQGMYSPEMVRHFKNNKFEIKFTHTGYVECTRSIIRILLTD